MFIIDTQNRLSFLHPDFINRYALPPLQVLTGKPLIYLLTLITDSDNNEHYGILRGIAEKIKNKHDGKDIICKITIKHQIYKMTFRKLIDGRTAGHVAKIGVHNSTSNIVNIHSQKDHLSHSSKTPGPGTPKAHATIAPIRSNKLPRILVVDDSAVNREVAGIFLSPDFPDIHYANNGEEALSILSEHRIDLILMDVHMPIMNGVEATLAIRESPKPLSDIIIIALTADTEYQHRRVYQNIGMNDAIPKPIRQDLLIRTILKNWSTPTRKVEVKGIRYMSHV